MSAKKSQLDELTEIDDADILEAVDVSDTEGGTGGGAAGKNKRFTWGALKTFLTTAFPNLTATLGTAASKNVGTAAGTVAAGDHSHTGLSVQAAGTPSVRAIGTTATTAAAGNHGHDDATGSAAGFMPAADKTKLDGIETSADVTDAANVGSSIHGASAKATLADADKLPLIDTEASNVIKTITYGALKTLLAAIHALKGAVTTSGLTMATNRILGRASASTGAIEELTLSQVLDLVGSAAQGDILYRGSAGWERLGAGTSGHFLKTNGAGANPAWAAVSGSGSGKLVNWAYAKKDDTASVTGQAFATVFSGAITPTSAANSIVIIAMLNLGGSGNFPCLKLLRGATDVLRGDAAGSRSRVISQTSTSGTNPMVNAALVAVDTPATTSEVTYNIDLASQTTGTVYLNRSNADTDSASFCRGSSSILFLELAP